MFCNPQKRKLIISSIVCLLDITYPSLAKAFGQELRYHEETQRRMDEVVKHRAEMQNQTEAQKTAMLRMTLFPADAEVIFVAEELWVVRMFPPPFPTGLEQ